MSSNIIALAFLCLISLTLIHTSHAQNSQADYLNAHNTARSAVGVGNIVWNATVAIYAQNYANQMRFTCQLVNSGGPDYSENIASGSGLFTGTMAVSVWVSEGQYYDHATNSCATGHICSHYTQVVWANSAQLGCGRAQCTSGLWYVVCSYYGKGNIPGQSPY